MCEQDDYNLRCGMVEEDHEVFGDTINIETLHHGIRSLDGWNAIYDEGALNTIAMNIRNEIDQSILDDIRQGDINTSTISHGYTVASDITTMDGNINNLPLTPVQGDQYTRDEGTVLVYDGYQWIQVDG